MTITTSEVEVEDARKLLGFFNEPGGYTPGGFSSALIEAMLRADQTNLALLRVVYPSLGLAVHLYKNVPGGLDQLTELVNSHP